MDGGLGGAVLHQGRARQGPRQGPQSLMSSLVYFRGEKEGIGGQLIKTGLHRLRKLPGILVFLTYRPREVPVPSLMNQ